jgi:tRNA G37 N-methylase Trm5
MQFIGENANQSKTALFCRDLNPKSINTIQKAVKRNKTDNWEREREQPPKEY